MKMQYIFMVSGNRLPVAGEGFARVGGLEVCYE